MYAYSLRRFSTRATWWRRPQKLIEKLRRLESKKGSRAAANLFLQQVGVYPLEAYNNSYYADVVNFNIGQLLAHCGDGENASELLGKSGLLPANSGHMLFTDHQYTGLKLYAHQLEAAKRGMASIMISSLPKSGSASLTQCLSEIMDAPIMRLSIGHTTDYFLVQKWLEIFQHGGMLTHDHFPAVAHNLSVLKNTGIHRVIVQVRDPRASSFSYINMKLSQRDPLLPRPSRIKYYQESIFHAHVKWLQQWMEAEKAHPWLSIEWIKYRDFCSNPWLCFERIVSPVATSGPMQHIADKIKRKDAMLVTANFNAGNDYAWRQGTDKKLAQKMWDNMPKSLIDFLELEL